MGVGGITGQSSSDWLKLTSPRSSKLNSGDPNLFLNANVHLDYKPENHHFDAASNEDYICVVDFLQNLSCPLSPAVLDLDIAVCSLATSFPDNISVNFLFSKIF